MLRGRMRFYKALMQYLSLTEQAFLVRNTLEIMSIHIFIAWGRDHGFQVLYKT